MITIFAFRRAGLGLLSLLAATSLSASHRNVDVSIHDGRDPRRCDQISIAIGGRDAERSELRRTFAADASHPLRISIGQHSGLRVRGTDRGDAEVLLCKAAESVPALERIGISETGGALTVTGPSDEEWFGYLLVSVPKRAAAELAATNGPISMTGLLGRVSARTENGPIHISDSGGEIDAEAENGPIAFGGDGGNARLRTQNGPISVALSGAEWRGNGLDARAVNGPIHLRVPAGYRSGAIVESLGRSPFVCHGSGCSAARRSWDDEDRKRLELGAGPAVVRLATENGPVSIDAGSGKGGWEDEEEDEE